MEVCSPSSRADKTNWEVQVYAVPSPMHPDRITQIIQFALARARREEFGFGDLGEIHLLKLLYLADLAHAEAHGGESYTGISWVFFSRP